MSKIRNLSVITIILLAGALAALAATYMYSIEAIQSEQSQVQSNKLTGYAIDSIEDLPEIPTEKELRYASRTITYRIENSCSTSQKEQTRQAFAILDEQTVLDFIEIYAQAEEISVICSEDAPDRKTLAEGGPRYIIEMNNYTLIKNGSVKLYTTDACDQPNMVLHEIMHALGFDHDEEEASVMHPQLQCQGQLLPKHKEEINTRYADNATADLELKEANATKTGNLLNFEAQVANSGLDNADTVITLKNTDGTIIKSYALGYIEPGASKTIKVDNVYVAPSITGLVVSVDNNQFIEEFDETNNEIMVNL